MKKRKKRAKKGEPQTVTKAVTHIRLDTANPGKLAALDQLAQGFLALTQQYVTLFCTDELPDSFRVPCFPTPLSERWHRVAIQQAAGIAKSWRTNRATAYEDHLDALASYQEHQADGKTYGTFHGRLRERQKRDREKRRRKAKLRHCLEKKGVPKDKLPSTSSATGQRLIRHVRQEINRAVNRCFAEHEDCQVAYEQLSVATMRHKARAMNAYMRASNLGHIPDQIAWNATKRGIAATRVNSAYSSQECPVCHYVDRKNRPNQQTFCCRVCGHTAHADSNASQNIAARLHDAELRACANRQEVKALLLRRHEHWKQNGGLVVVQPTVQLGLWGFPRTSTDVAQR